MRISPNIFRVVIFIACLLLIISLGLCYYYGINADYTFEVYIFMTAAAGTWVILFLLLSILMPRYVISKRQAWVSKHGHIAFAKITSFYTTEHRNAYNRKMTIIHNIVRTEDGLEFTIDFEPLLKTNDNVVVIRYDEDCAIFDNKTMRLIYKKKIIEATFSDYIQKNENYVPIPKDLSGDKKTLVGKKLIIGILAFIILANYIIPTVIIMSNNNTNNEAVTNNTTKWNDEIKTKSKTILGFELPEYDLGYTGSYYVTDAKQRLYDTNLNSGYLYPNGSEFSFHFLSSGPSDDKLSSYATYLSLNYGFTKNYDLLDLDYYTNVNNACSETNPSGVFHYIQLKKDSLYIVITKSYSTGYYNYMNYAAELKKDVWLTCIKL